MLTKAVVFDEQSKSKAVHRGVQTSTGRVAGTAWPNRGKYCQEFGRPSQPVPSLAGALVRRLRGVSTQGRSAVEAVQGELKRLPAEIKRLRMEHVIRKKTMAFFASESS